MRPIMKTPVEGRSPAPRPSLSAKGRTWAILLAGGKGQRLSSLIGRIHPDQRPKQYATIIGTRSMLQHTYARALAHALPDRILTVITEGQERWALGQLPQLPARNFLIQPRGLDTGPAVLFALADLLERDPAATALLFPTDHFIFPEDGLRRPVAEALAAIQEAGGDSTVLLGARPTGPDSEMGWILPEAAPRRRASAMRRVLRFVEKPPREVAQSLLAEGALWNTFIMATGARAMHRMIEKHRPEAAEGIGRYLTLRRGGAWRRELNQAFEAIKPFNLSSQVLEQEAGSLSVTPLGTAEWSDWGTLKGIQRSLESLGWNHKFTALAAASGILSRQTLGPPPWLATADGLKEEASP